jgi:small conductance mechanosensitive channel
MDTQKMMTALTEQGTRIGLQLLGAVALWVVGRWLIGLAVRLTRSGMDRQKVDPTVANYVVATLTGVLNVLLVISILGAFGVQTATFAALIAALGLAIGTALSGLLGNFAAGFFMVVLRPFRVGDLIEAGGVLGTVVEIGPFATKLNTLDNIQVIVGNGKILGDNIRNFSHNPFRRVDLVMQLDHGTDVPAVMGAVKTRLAAVSNVLGDPAPDVEILEFNLAGPKLAVRPYCNNEHYWQVYFDTNEVIRAVGAEFGLSAPASHVVVHANRAGEAGAPAAPFAFSGGGAAAAAVKPA